MKGLIFSTLLLFVLSCSPPPPKKFVANIPKEPDAENVFEFSPNENAAIIIVQTDGALLLNAEKIGTINDTGKLESELAKIFAARKKLNDKDATTVFLKVPRDTKYGVVEALIDKLKKVGAAPIGLHIEGLEQ